MEGENLLDLISAPKRAEEINSTKDAMVKNIDFGCFRVQGLAVDGGDHMQCTT